MDTQRSKFLPDVPTTPELGYPSVMNLDRGIAAVKGTPPDVVKKLQEVFRKAMEDPEHVKKMEDAGLSLRIMVGEEYARYYRDLHAKAAKYTGGRAAAPTDRRLLARPDYPQAMRAPALPVGCVL